MATVRAVVQSLLVAYLAAVFVNALRIVLALWLARQGQGGAGMHRVSGIVVYFGGLLLLQAALMRGARSHGWQKWALPLAIYEAVALAVPIVNGKSGSLKFSGHAAMVLLIPVLMLAAAFVLRRVRSAVAGADARLSHF